VGEGVGFYAMALVKSVFLWPVLFGIMNLEVFYGQNRYIGLWRKDGTR